MSRSIRSFAAFATGSALLLLPLVAVAADDGPEGQSLPKTNGAQSKTSQSQSKAEPAVPEISLLDAAKQGLISVQAEGIGDGRMTVTLKNRTNKKLHVILPPGLVAQGATGQSSRLGSPSESRNARVHLRLPSGFAGVYFAALAWRRPRG